MKTQPFKFLSRGIFLLAVVTSLLSCSKQAKKEEDTKAVAEEHNEAKFDKADEKDAAFLVTAAEINQEEIRLGQLAQQNGRLADVKELGKAMEAGHTKALKAVKELAAKKTISLPTAATENVQDAYKKLISKHGNDFDKAYCDKMVDGHKKAIQEFESAEMDSKDIDIKAWASSMLPALRSHLDHAMICQAKCAKMASK